jgi:hypothetical protein
VHEVEDNTSTAYEKCVSFGVQVSFSIRFKKNETAA